VKVRPNKLSACIIAVESAGCVAVLVLGRFPTKPATDEFRLVCLHASGRVRLEWGSPASAWNVEVIRYIHLIKIVVKIMFALYYRQMLDDRSEQLRILVTIHQ